MAKPEGSKSEPAKSDASEPDPKAEPKRDRAAAEKKDAPAGTSGEVVRLDRFRKK
jgi:hypothetical protein